MSTAVQTHPLISIRADATVQEAARLMADCSIGAVGVLDEAKRFKGIITERDLTWFVAQGRDPEETHVHHIVNDFPVVVDGPISDSAAVDRMRTARVRHLIVREGDDYRILSIRDFLSTTLGGPAEPSAREIMTAPAVACREEAFFEEVAETLAERDISGMPVVDKAGEVVGVISERDLAHALGGPMIRLAVRRHDHGPFLRDVSDMPRGSRRAKDVMTSPPLVVQADAPLSEVARLMRTHQVNRIPVVEGSHLIGVVSRGDVLGAIAHLDRGAIDLTRPPVLVGSVDEHQTVPWDR